MNFWTFFWGLCVVSSICELEWPAVFIFSFLLYVNLSNLKQGKSSSEEKIEYVKPWKKAQTTIKPDEKINSATTAKVTIRQTPSVKLAAYNRNPTKEEMRKERNKMNSALREKILSRDNYTCKKCGLSRCDEPHLALHVDHSIPIAKGGKTVETNLQTLCWQCNLSKGSKIEEEL